MVSAGGRFEGVLGVVVVVGVLPVVDGFPLPPGDCAFNARAKNSIRRTGIILNIGASNLSATVH
jgi:hypothetical protein